MSSAKHQSSSGLVTLFFDLEVTGHHVEYISHLIRYGFHYASSPGKFIFVLHPSTLECLTDFNLPEGWFESSAIEVPSEKELQLLEKKQLTIKRANTELKIAKRIGDKYQIDNCCLMSLNRFQLALGGRLGKSFSASIRGILFNPIGNTGAPLHDSLSGPRKRGQIRWMLRNNKINRIFLLNHEAKVTALNKYVKKENLFKSLPDPVLPTVSPGIHSVAAIGGNSNRVKFLLFGSLTKRKGVFTLLDALQVLPISASAYIEVVFAGKLAKEIRKPFFAQLKRIKRNKADLTLTVIDKCLSNGEMANLFSRVDCILAPYIGSQASSGILGHAAFYKKPIIGPDSGLIGKLIKGYQLGLAIRPMCAQTLSEAIIEVLDESSLQLSTRGMELYVHERHPDRFVQTLLE